MYDRSAEGKAASALLDLEGVAGRYETARKAWRDTYFPIDDGNAAARATDLLLG